MSDNRNGRLMPSISSYSGSRASASADCGLPTLRATPVRVRNDVAKNEAIALYTPGQQIEVMRALKHTLDPNNILNPGKLLPQA